MTRTRLDSKNRLTRPSLHPEVAPEILLAGRNDHQAAAQATL